MGLSLSIKMNRERLPKAGAGATAKVTARLTRAELRALDRFCAERLLSRSQVVRRALKAHLLERTIGPEA
jgi:Ribbon-helix-helix protein, copG family